MSFASFATANAAFTRDLTIGSTGADVTELQTWLIGEGQSIPAGATGYFGAQTQAALAAWQAANGVAPAAGYFGPITRAAVMADGGDDDMDGDDADVDTDSEASLEDFDSSSGDDDDVAEGSTGDVAEFSFDVEDGDAELQRLDLEFDNASIGVGDESEPWDTFAEVTLFVDGEEIASEDVSDEDEWLDNDDGGTDDFVFRFTGLDTVANDGDTVEVVVQVEAQDGVDLGGDDLAGWMVAIPDDGVRALDGAGIDQYTGDSTETVAFNVEQEGAGEELNISASPEDPDGMVIAVDDDAVSEWTTIFAFELDAEESDIELDTVGVSASTTDAGGLDDVLNDARIVIDGEEFDDLTGSLPTTMYGLLNFDVDGDFTVDEGDTVTAELQVKFNAQGATTYATGTMIHASTTGGTNTGEGSDDVTASGSANGDTHTLQVAGVNFSEGDSDTATVQVVDGTDNDYGTLTVKLDVESFDDDAYIDQNAGLAVMYQIENAGTGLAVATTTFDSFSLTLTTGAPTEGSSYRFEDGEEESLTITAVLNPNAALEGQSYRLQILSVNFGATAATPGTSLWTAEPQSNYESPSVFIND